VYLKEPSPYRLGSAIPLAVDRSWDRVDIPLVDTVVDHTVVADMAVGHTVVVAGIVADHRLAAVADIVVDRTVAVVECIAADCTAAAVNSQVVHTVMDMIVVVDTGERIAQLVYSQFEQVALAWQSQTECHNWSRNARQVRPVGHNWNKKQVWDGYSLQERQ
jgi:hypothetical protein